MLAMELIRIPKFSENMEEATIVEWLKAEGETVAAGELLLSVITDKADFEIESPASGTLLKIVAPEKSSVPIRYVVGLVGTPGEALPDVEGINREAREQFLREALKGKPAEGPPSVAGAAPGPEPVQPRGPETAGGRIAATPAAKRLARDRGIDLAEVARWARPAGPITQELIEEFVQRGHSPRSPGTP
jgi:pyruvate dehydrogenase E2 component (dihydrolipoamide acetyltransferase)